MKDLPSVRVKRAASGPLRRGHPWLWREQAESLRGIGEGDEVRVMDGAEVMGRGLASPSSPIAVRMWTHGDRPVDDALLDERLGRAMALRDALFDGGETNAYRLVHGEGDRLPGFVVDCYADVAVLRTDGEGARARLDWMATALRRALRGRVRTLVHRTVERGAAPAAHLLDGPPPPDVIEVREHGVPFVVDLARGQKTGAFLDQRENRRRVGSMARGKRVLNLFSYAGGFSLHAARGGATHVTSVDVAAAAHATAQESFRRAGLDPSRHAFVSADAFAFLEDAARRREAWDLVVSDPPSFAPSEKARARALASYRRLHRLAAGVLAPGGTLCAASCSSHVDASAFASTLDDDALGRGDLRLVALYGPPPDHPTLPAWPEGRYLKFAVLT